MCRLESRLLRAPKDRNPPETTIQKLRESEHKHKEKDRVSGSQIKLEMKENGPKDGQLFSFII